MGSLDVRPTASGKLEITNFQVDAGHRKRNVGRMLMDAALLEAQRHGLSGAQLEARSIDGSLAPAALVEVYQKMGFRTVGVSRRGSPVMERGIVQRKFGHRVIQRSTAAYQCPKCGQTFANERGLTTHQTRWAAKCQANVNDEDSWSDWSQHSLDEDRKQEVFASSSRKSKQPSLYEQNKKILEEEKLNFHSSEGLAKAVEYVGHGGKGQFAANTHLLVSGMDGTRVMVNLSTLNAMTAMALRHGAQTLPAASNVLGKSTHVHAEMYLIWVLTNGDPNQIDGCMKGLHLAVDKPVCQQCYPYVKRAAPSQVQDTTNFESEDASSSSRGDFSSTWRSPFQKQFESKKIPDNPFG